MSNNYLHAVDINVRYEHDEGQLSPIIKTFTFITEEDDKHDLVDEVDKVAPPQMTMSGKTYIKAATYYPHRAYLVYNLMEGSTEVAAGNTGAGGVVKMAEAFAESLATMLRDYHNRLQVIASSKRDTEDMLAVREAISVIDELLGESC